MRRRCFITALLLPVALCLQPAVSACAPAAVPAAPAQVAVVNDGVPGENSTELRARFLQELARVHPRFVVLYTGMNDAVNDKKFTTMQAFASNVEWMLQATMHAHAVPVLVAIQPVDEQRLLQRHDPAVYGTRAPNRRIADHNVLLARIARRYRVAVVPFDNDLTAVGGPTPQWSPDGVHLYAAGYKLLATAVWRVLEPLWKAGEPVLCIGDSLTFGQGARPQGAGLLDADGKPYPTYPQYLSEFAAAASR